MGLSTDYFTISARGINRRPVATVSDPKPPPKTIRIACIWGYRLVAPEVACASVLPYGCDACATAHGLSRVELPHAVCGIDPLVISLRVRVHFVRFFLRCRAFSCRIIMFWRAGHTRVTRGIRADYARVTRGLRAGSRARSTRGARDFWFQRVFVSFCVFLRVFAGSGPRA